MYLQSLGRNVDANGVEFAVAELAARQIIGERILAAQLVADLRERLRQIVYAVREKRAASAVFRKLLQHLIAGPLLNLAVETLRRVGLLIGQDPIGVAADRVDDDAGALRDFQSLAARMAAQRVVAITDDD